MKTRGLGDRGLSSLLIGSSLDHNKENLDVVDGEMKQLPVEFLRRGKYQPRREMDQETLEELAVSIRQQGIMQPIVVRSISKDIYEIIAGERRWRAAQLAELDKVPAIIRNVDDNAAIAMALIENIQRENLNAIEEAVALQRLQEEFELTQGEVAEAVGKSRTTVTNLLRLINLTDEVKRMLEQGDLEMGHGRAMLSLNAEQQVIVARQVVSKALSVRQTETVVRRILEEKPTKSVADKESNADVKRLEQELSEKIGSAVNIERNSKGKGKLVIKYNSLDELDGILAHIN